MVVAETAKRIDVFPERLEWHIGQRDSGEITAAGGRVSCTHDLKTVVLLFEYEDLSYDEIASVLDCSPKAVETRLYRARKILREKLEHLVHR